MWSGKSHSGKTRSTQIKFLDGKYIKFLLYLNRLDYFQQNLFWKANLFQKSNLVTSQKTLAFIVRP